MHRQSGLENSLIFGGRYIKGEIMDPLVHVDYPLRLGSLCINARDELLEINVHRGFESFECAGTKTRANQTFQIIMARLVATVSRDL
jgi:hypothetical protein